MSKFIDAIEKRETGVQYPDMLGAISSKLEEVPERARDGIMREYYFGVRWNIRFCCHQKDLKASMDNAYKQLRHDVYGEFISRLLRLEKAMLSRDLDKAMAEIRDLMTEAGVK